MQNRISVQAKFVQHNFFQIFTKKNSNKKPIKSDFWCPITVSSNCFPAIAVSTQSTINNIPNTATNTSPSIKTLLITSSATSMTTTTTNFTSSSCNPQYLRLMQNSSYHRRHSVSGTVNRRVARWTGWCEMGDTSFIILKSEIQMLLFF